MPTDLVTVLLPCKDEKPDYLRAAIGSVFAQTVAGWQLIVITDHGRDPATLAVLHELRSAEDSRVRIIPNESQWVTGALNTAMRHVTTPFVCALHADDLLEDNAIQVLQEAIRSHPEVDYFHSARIHIDDGGRPKSRVIAPVEDVKVEDFHHRGPVKHLHCWRREAALAIGGMDESLGLHGADDYDFPWCMAEAGCSFRAIPICLYRKRDHRSHYRLTTHVPLDVQTEELRKIFRKHGLSPEEIEEQIAIRTGGYLRQALYLDEKDRQRKNEEGYDIRQGWQIRYEL